MQLAIATHIPVSVWLQEPNEIIVTAIDELNRQAERMKRK